MIPLQTRSPILGLKCYRMGECSILVGIENGRWHISIAHPKRYPTWNEIRDARYTLTPNDVTMVMVLPPKEQYVNVHKNCFHLWQTFDKNPGEWG